jgi:hypothetical protein
VCSSYFWISIIIGQGLMMFLLGQLKETLLRTSLCMANVKFLLEDHKPTRAVVQDLISKMDQIDKEDTKGECLPPYWIQQLQHIHHAML